MSTSLLYHAFGLKDQKYLKTEYKEGQVIFHVKTKASKLRCSNCGSSHVKKKGSIPRDFQTQSIGLKPVILHINVQRLGCEKCGKILQEDLSFADKKKDILEVLQGS